MLLRFEGKQLYLQEIYTQYANLLPKKKHLEILSFIYTLVMKLYDNTAIKHFDFTLDKNILTIKAEDSLYLVEEKLQGLESPLNIEIETIDKREIPYYAF
jgi:hypothetical protein